MAVLYDYSNPLTGSFTATGQSPSFQATTGRGINVTISGTFSASAVLERSFDGGTVWYPVTYPDGTGISFTAAFSGPAWEESESRVLYRLNCTWVSGTMAYRVSQ
jgi:hypothetical protein